MGASPRRRRAGDHAPKLRVPPHALGRVVVFDPPNAIVDGASSPSVFHGEVGRSREIERDHTIVHMASQVDPDRSTAFEAEVARDAHIEERVALQREMVDPLRHPSASMKAME